LSQSCSIRIRYLIAFGTNRALDPGDGCALGREQAML
jgi:hypothetical protein